MASTLYDALNLRLSSLKGYGVAAPAGGDGLQRFLEGLLKSVGSLEFGSKAY
jgi:hypothetical protein